MSRIECEHVKYCGDCDRYHCDGCPCACNRPKITHADAMAGLMCMKCGTTNNSILYEGNLCDSCNRTK